MKVLLALLDQEAAAQPCANKADLLSEDRGTSVVTLFRSAKRSRSGDTIGSRSPQIMPPSVSSLLRSPEVSKGCSPEPPKKRAPSRLDPLKPKVTRQFEPPQIESDGQTFMATWRPCEPRNTARMPHTHTRKNTANPRGHENTSEITVVSPDFPPRSIQTRPLAVRSQFACTYRKEEEPPLNRVLHFPSSSQVPTCVHPAPKAESGAAPAGKRLAFFHTPFCDISRIFTDVFVKPNLPRSSPCRFPLQLRTAR